MRLVYAKLAVVIVLVCGLLGTAAPAWMQGGELAQPAPITSDNVANIAPLMTVNRADLHPNRAHLLYATPDGAVWLLDLASGIAQRAASGLTPESRAKFGPQEGMLTLYGFPEGGVVVASFTEGRVITHYTGNRAQVEDVAYGYTAEGEPLIASWDYDGDVHIWEALTGARRFVIDTDHSPNNISGYVFLRGMEFSIYANYLFIHTGGHLWNLTTGEDVTYCLNAFELGASEEVFACWDIDEGIVIGDPATGEQRRMLPVQGGVFSPLAFLANDDFLVASNDTEVTFWNVETGELIRTYEGTNAALDPTRTRMVYQDLDYVLHVMNLSGGESQELAAMGQYAQYDQFGDPYDDADRQLIVRGNRAPEGPTFGWWDLATGESSPLIQTGAGIRAVRLSPNRQVFAVLETDRVELWDARTGALLKSIDWREELESQQYEDFQFSADGGVLLVPDEDGATWLLGVAQDQTLASAEPSGLTLTALTQYDMEADYGAPHSPYECSIAEGDLLLLVGRAPESRSEWLVYASACEGPVWLYGTSGLGLELENEAAADRLPEVAPPEVAAPLDELPDYEALCEGATSAATGAVADYPLVAFIPRRVQARTSLPALFLATTPEEVDVVVCTAEERVQEGTCSYHGNNGQVSLGRYRVDLAVTLVETGQGQIVAQRTFGGSVSCPGVVSSNRGSILGDPPAFETWRSWLLDQLTGQPGMVLRTMVGGSPINARAEPGTDAEILGQLAAGTPVNLIGRNKAGDWVLALTPEMDKVWLAADLLQVAVQTDVTGLPVVSGPADQIAVPLP